MRGYLRQATVAVLTAIMLYTNLSSGSGGGFTDDPDNPAVFFQYPTGFSPAPFTFAIWLPIFVGTIALAIFQALPAQRTNANLDRIALPYSIALIANALTPFADLGVSNVVVTILFLALAVAYSQTLSPDMDRKARIFLRTPIAVFCTWAALAMVLNACQWVVAQGGTVDADTAAILVAATMSVGIVVMLKTREVAIAAVMIWAGIGIAAANIDAPWLLATIVLTSFASAFVAVLPRSHAS